MSRLVLLPLCALLGASALAAPVPPPRPAPGPWWRGWEKPEGHEGDCRFEREWGKLTVTVPGDKRRPLTFARGRGGPRLLREVEGDFRLQARVTLPRPGAAGTRVAGLVVVSGRHAAITAVRARRGEEGPASTDVMGGLRGPDGIDVNYSPLAGRAAHLRLERRGQRLVLEASPDGVNWKALADREWPLVLPDKVKAGVFVVAYSGGPFVATFDHLRFTQPRARGR